MRRQAGNSLLIAHCAAWKERGTALADIDHPPVRLHMLRCAHGRPPARTTRTEGSSQGLFHPVLCSQAPAQRTAQHGAQHVASAQCPTAGAASYSEMPLMRGTWHPPPFLLQPRQARCACFASWLPLFQLQHPLPTPVVIGHQADVINVGVDAGKVQACGCAGAQYASGLVKCQMPRASTPTIAWLSTRHSPCAGRTLLGMAVLLAYCCSAVVHSPCSQHSQRAA